MVVLRSSFFMLLRHLYMAISLTIILMHLYPTKPKLTIAFDLVADANANNAAE